MAPCPWMRFRNPVFCSQLNSRGYYKLDGDDLLDIDTLLDFSGKGFKRATLILEDGMRFNGNSIGVDGFAIGEVVFNTSITGYQEILSDPSYCLSLIHI